jgi:hypothetical protein
LIFQFPEESKAWHINSNSIVCLSVKDEQSLLKLSEKLSFEGIKHVLFREPDIQNQITSIAIEPCDRAKKICSNMPLALKGIGNGVNKHNYQTV